MIKLVRQIEVRCFDVEGTVALGQFRPEFLAVAKLAQDIGPLDGPTVVRELLAGLPVPFGWRVIDRCLALGLLVRMADSGPASISASGIKALEAGEVLVPEEGAWRFHVAKDPLVPCPVLHVEKLDTGDARAERNDVRDQKAQGGQAPRGAPLSNLLGQHVGSGRRLVSVLNGRGFEVRAVGSHGDWSQQGSLELWVTCEEDQSPRLSLRGALPVEASGRPMPVDASFSTPDHLEEPTYEDLWLGVVGAKFRDDVLARWLLRTGRREVPMAFGSVADADRRTFKHDVVVNGVDLGAFGEFGPTQLKGVPIAPLTIEDAAAWAEWLQWDGLGRYATPSTIDEISRGVAARFPEHASKLRLPDASALLGRARSNPADGRSRFLLAPSDLGLWR